MFDDQILGLEYFHKLSKTDVHHCVWGRRPCPHIYVSFHQYFYCQV